MYLSFAERIRDANEKYTLSITIKPWEKEKTTPLEATETKNTRLADSLIQTPVESMLLVTEERNKDAVKS